MQAVLLIIAIALTIALYRMLSRGGKTYPYAGTQTTSFQKDGTEQVVPGNENGSIIITNKTVLIDGIEYCYKPMEGEQLQAILDYDESGLCSVRVILSEGEKRYFIRKSPSKKTTMHIA